MIRLICLPVLTFLVEDQVEEPAIGRQAAGYTAAERGSRNVGEAAEAATGGEAAAGVAEEVLDKVSDKLSAAWCAACPLCIWPHVFFALDCCFRVQLADREIGTL